MKRTIGLMLAMFFAIAVWMPADSSAQVWRTRRVERTTVYNDRYQNHEQRERRRRWRSRMYQNMGYRNYGQYRRTQVGRYRWERQTYYNNGRRYTRMVRIYF